MNRTKIEWVKGPNGEPGYTWNPVTGCLHGCPYCYARRITERFKGTDAFPKGFEPTFHLERLNEPSRVKKPSKIFTCSMADLFGEWVPSYQICDVLNVVEDCSQHTFLFLTKNPQRYHDFNFPKNAWLGVSVENQQTADERNPLLSQIPAAVRFISVEPMLGPVILRKKATDEHEIIQAALMGRMDEYSRPVERGIDWVIAGGETGPGARPVHPDWIRSLRDQCQDAGVPFFFKGWGDWLPMFDQPWDEAPMGRGEGRFRIINHAGGHGYHGAGAMWTKRVSKKKAGRLLDGRTWKEFPEVTR